MGREETLLRGRSTQLTLERGVPTGRGEVAELACDVSQVPIGGHVCPEATRAHEGQMAKCGSSSFLDEFNNRTSLLFQRWQSSPDP